MLNPICDICHKPVKLETSKTNELGKAIHEGCYLRRVSSKKATSPRKASRPPFFFFTFKLEHDPYFDKPARAGENTKA